MGRKGVLAIVLSFILLLPVQASGDRVVALTFDDGPSGRFTRRLLEGLEQRQVKATFYLCGYRLEQYGALAEDIYNRGHEIGLHGYSHQSMAQMSADTIREELRRTQALLPEGCLARTMRPPGGRITAQVEQVAAELGLEVALWSVDPQDWATDCAGLIHDRVLADVQPGDIVLLHDMSDSSVDAALELVDDLLEQGYRFVTVSELEEMK